MITVLFFVNELTFLRYFIPLAQRCILEGMEVTFALGRSGKYNCPQAGKALAHATIYGAVPEAAIIDIKSLKKIHDVEVVIEGISSGGACKVLSYTYMIDFIVSAKNYIDRIDRLLMPSQYFTDLLADKGGVHDYVGSKVFPVGSPKYCLPKSMLEEHSLADEEYSLMLYHPEVSMDLFVENIKQELDLGGKVIAKTRGKHPLTLPIRDQRLTVMYDEEWYPHTTMKLIHTAQRIVNFDSSVVKEVYALDRMNIMRNVPSKKETPLLDFYDEHEVYDRQRYLLIDDHEETMSKSIYHIRKLAFEIK